MSISEVSSQSIDTLFESAVSALKENNGEKVDQIAEQILKNHPNHVATLHLKALSLLLTKKVDEADQLCDSIEKKVNANQWENTRFKVPKGTIYMIHALTKGGKQEMDKAMDYIESAIKVNRIAPFIQVRAMIHCQQENFDKAREDLQDVINHPFQGTFLGIDSEKGQQMAKLMLQMLDAKQ